MRGPRKTSNYKPSACLKLSISRNDMLRGTARDTRMGGGDFEGTRIGGGGGTGLFEL